MRVMAGCFRGWARLLRPLYGVKKHEPMYVIGCTACGKLSDDIRENKHALDGWRTVPEEDAACPECLESGAANTRTSVDLEELRKRYVKRMIEIVHGGKL